MSRQDGKSSVKMEVGFLITEDDEGGDQDAGDDEDTESGTEHLPEETVSHDQMCSTCGAVLKFKGEVLFHQHIHGIKDCALICETCQLGFSKRYTYRNHVKCVHNKEKRYKCSQCDKAFFFRKDLPKHITAVHNRAKPHKCPQCDRGFAKREHMYRHVRTVHGQTPPLPSGSHSKETR